MPLTAMCGRVQASSIARAGLVVRAHVEAHGRNRASRWSERAELTASDLPVVRCKTELVRWNEEDEDSPVLIFFSVRALPPAGARDESREHAQRRPSATRGRVRYACERARACRERLRRPRF